MLPKFDVHVPLQQSYQRKLAFALGVRDGVSQRLITAGLDIRADNGVAPRVNASGWHIWMTGADAKPTVIKINAEATGLENLTLKVPVTTTADEVELSPLPSYPFPSGATAFRSRLIDGIADVVGALVQLELRVQLPFGPVWQSAGPTSMTSKIGEFAVLFRPPPPQVGDEGAPDKVTVRLRFERLLGGNVQPSKRHGAEFQLPVGLITTKSQVVDWLQLMQL